MKRIIMVLAVIMLMSIVPATAQENRFVEEFKNWDFSLGGIGYLRKADDFYYAAGAKRDLAQFFNGLDKERLYGEIGYLNAKMLNNYPDKPLREYGYAGLSTNANFIAQMGIKGINQLLNSNFQTPEIVDKVLATVGILVAKRFDDTFWDIRHGYDYGAVVSIMKQW